MDVLDGQIVFTISVAIMECVGELAEIGMCSQNGGGTTSGG